jgi:class 3 adenylate cyclase/ligand-binding sensor domain-containing protein
LFMLRFFSTLNNKFNNKLNTLSRLSRLNITLRTFSRHRLRFAAAAASICAVCVLLVSAAARVQPVQPVQSVSSASKQAPSEVTITASAAPPAMRHAMSFRHYSVEHGLSQNTVFAMLQDSKGFVWFGTGDGLNRFDGMNFVVMRRGDNSALTNSYVTALQEDASKLIWVGTKDGGVNAMDPERRSVVAVLRGGEDGALPSNHIAALLVSRDKRTLWIATEDAGVVALDLQKFHRAYAEYRNNDNDDDNDDDGITADSNHGKKNDNNERQRSTMQNAATANGAANNSAAGNAMTSGAMAAMSASVLGSAEQQTLWADCLTLRLNTSNGLPHNATTCLAQDGFGALWIGTLRGIARLEASTQRSQAAQHQTQTQTQTQQAQPHWTYFTTRSSATSTTVPSAAFASAPAQKSAPKTPPSAAAGITFKAEARAIACDTIRCILADPTNSNATIWVGTEAGGLSAFEPQSGSWTTFRANTDNLKNRVGSAIVFVDNLIHTLFRDKQRRLWIGTGTGLVLLAAEDADGAFATRNAATNASKAWQIQERRANGFMRIERNPLNPRSISGTNVFSVMQDSSGVVWVSTYGTGLNAFHDNTSAFTTYSFIPNNPTGLPANGISSFCETTIVNPGTLWVGTWTSGIARLDRTRNDALGEHGAFTVFRRDEARPTAPTSLSDDYVRCITETRIGALAGLLWVGTMHGIDVFDPRTERVVARFKNNPNDSNSLSGDNILCITEDSRGAVWVGTIGKGMSRYEPPAATPATALKRSNQALSGGRWTQFMFTPTAPNSPKRPPTGLSNNIVRQIVEEPAGFSTNGSTNSSANSSANGSTNTSTPRSAAPLWIATRGGGLCRFDPATETFTTFRHNPSATSAANASNAAGDSRSLPADGLFGLHFDKKGALWIGTQGAGLSRFDPKTQIFRTYTEADGLPNSVVYGALEDDNGNLWCSTNKGITRVSAGTQTQAQKSSQKPVLAFRNFDVRDGLQSDEFNSGAIYKGSSGRMYFGGVAGFNEFFPDDAQDNTAAPPVFITAFKIFNEEFPVAAPAADGSANDSLSEIPSVFLSHNDNYFSFEFAALNYLLPEKNTYSYMLEGLDVRWVNAGTKREASYTNLSEGEYIFRVRAANNDGVWNSKGTAMRVVISPPWWRSWWFRVVSVLLGVGLVYMLYRIRTRALKEIAYRLERDVQARTLEISERNAQLSGANEEIQRQLSLLDEQTRAIELANTELQDKNMEIERAREQSDALLLNVLPVPIAERLKAGEQNIADCFDDVTVLFADIVGFTQLATRQSAGELVQLLNRVFSAFDIFSEQYGLEKIKTIGDAYMIVGGVPQPSPDPHHHVVAVARMALEMLQTVELLSKTTSHPLAIRIGVQTGTVVAGVIGQKKFAYDLWGDAVNTASRMESHGVSGKIHVTEEVYLALRDEFVFEERGEVDIKGKGVMRTWFLIGAR